MPPDSSCELVWVTKKATPKDIEATGRFLSLRQSMTKEFNDTKNCKNSLWLKIANELNGSNFFVGTGSDGAERCRKKFSNLQSSYQKHKDKKRQTGEGNIPKPPFFEEIDAILGNKDKTIPQIIIDSLNDKPVYRDEEMDTSLPSTSKETTTPSIANRSTVLTEKETTSTKGQNRFNNIKTSARPDRNKFLGEMLELQKRDMEQRKQEFNQVMAFMEKSSSQRHEEIMAMFQSKKKGKKRRRESSSESD